MTGWTYGSRLEYLDLMSGEPRPHLEQGYHYCHGLNGISCWALVPGGDSSKRCTDCSEAHAELMQGVYSDDPEAYESYLIRRDLGS